MIPGSASQFFLGASQAAGGAGGFQVSRSLRFNGSVDNSYLNRTPASAGNRRTWTWSAWIKRSVFGSDQMIFTSRPTASPYALFYFTSSDYLQFSDDSFGYIRTASVFRDPSAWYHIVLTVDTTGATAADYLKIYVNNVRQAIGASSLPALNSQGQINTATAHSIGSPQPYANNEYFNGYLANIHFIDGQALTPASFAETDATTGQWIPKAYSGSYGTNGFYLQFADNSNNTASTLGKDYSGLGNNWTPNNLSVTAGDGNDSLVDSPTNYGTDTYVGGEVRGNYATLNPLDKAVDVTLTNGNLDISHSGSSNLRAARATIKLTTGKWYCEAVRTTGTDCHSGIITGSSSLFQFASTSVFYGEDGKLYVDGSAATNYGITIAIGDVVGIAVDMDAAKIYFYKNGTLINTGGTSFTTTGNDWFFKVGTYFSGSVNTVNFGQRPFAYTAPSGYKALCTQNLPAPLVTKSNTVFDVITYTGTGSSLTLPNGSSTPTSIAFTPDFVWLKGRSGATDHAIYDSVRDVQKDLVSNSTAAETTETTGLTAFGTNTFTVGSLAKLNTTSATYVAWAWDAGTSTVSNPDGSITSQVRANASAGFSVVTYTGNGTSGATVGHGLNVAPQLLIVKRRSSAGATANWAVWHGSLTAGQNLFLNTTDSASAYSPSRFTSTLPTSTVFSIGGDDETNYSGGTYVCYAFSPVVGYSNGFSYTGDGNADGSFVYLGFRPRLIMLKRSDSTSNWTLLDTSREGYNVDNDPLYPNTADAEGTADLVDITSNGFKLRTTDVSVNASAGTYIGFAWAEMPFNYSRAR